jgi:hypothetical protein
MREVGLIYLEELGNLRNECLEGHPHDKFQADTEALLRKFNEDVEKCDSAFGRWAKIFDALERRIDLTLRESKRPAGDIPFFKLLQDARVGESIYLRSGNILSRQNNLRILKEGNFIPASSSLPLSPEKEKEEISLNDQYLAGYLNCQVHAEQNIKSGLTQAYTPMQSPTTVATDDDNCLKGGGRIPSPPKVGRDADTCSKRSSCEAEARSWRTQPSCAREGFNWVDGVCHSTSQE